MDSAGRAGQRVRGGFLDFHTSQLNFAFPAFSAALPRVRSWVRPAEVRHARTSGARVLWVPPPSTGPSHVPAPEAAAPASPPGVILVLTSAPLSHGCVAPFWCLRFSLVRFLLRRPDGEDSAPFHPRLFLSPARLSQLSHKCGPVRNRCLRYAVSTGSISLLVEPWWSFPAELCFPWLIISFVHLLSFLCDDRLPLPLGRSGFPSTSSSRRGVPDLVTCSGRGHGLRPSLAPPAQGFFLLSLRLHFGGAHPPVASSEADPGEPGPSETSSFRPLNRDGGRCGVLAGVEVAFLPSFEAFVPGASRRSPGCCGKEQPLGPRVLPVSPRALFLFLSLEAPQRHPRPLV